MYKIRVLVVDDHTIVQDSICALLALVGDIEVVGEAAQPSPYPGYSLLYWL